MQAQQLPTLSYETVVFNQVQGSTPILSPIPTNASPGTNCSTANSMCAIQNTGMGSHLFSYCIVGGTATGVKFWGEATNDTTITAGVLSPTNWQQITQTATSITGCAQVQGGGYWSYLRIHLDTFTGTTPVMTAWYSGIGTALPGGGPVIANTTAQPITFNAGNVSTANQTIPGVFTTKSTPTLLGISDSVLYGLGASNPNSVVVFASLQCNGVSPVTSLQWEIPANDHRSVDLGTVGFFCSFQPAVLCSTSATSAVDPTNSCIVDAVWKPNNVVNTKINFAGSVVNTQSQTPN